MNQEIQTEVQYKGLDYSNLLKNYGINFTSTGYYLQVGEINLTQGWILHLSPTRIKIPILLKIIIPELLCRNLSFKVIRDDESAAAIIEGNLGSINIGKSICIYPEDSSILVDIAKLLIKLTANFKGPNIPTDRHLGAIVYTRYGSFNPILQKDAEGQFIKLIYNHKNQLIPDPYNIPFKLPPGISWPFTDLTSHKIPKQSKLLNDSYYPISTLKPDAKGDVMKALYFKNIWTIKSCLIKQGRHNMFTDDQGRDIVDRLKWQFELYNNLSTHIPTPKIFEYFTIDENAYLAMEFIKGISLAYWINVAFHNRCWKLLHYKSKLQLLGPIISITYIIDKLHKRGYVHRDITPENFLIDKQQKIYLIDMELTWSIPNSKPAPPFKMGTPGFMSPEQQQSQTPTEKEDIYGLGALMIVFFTNLSPVRFQFSTQQQLQENLNFFIDDTEIVNIIKDCLSPIPFNRPTISNITQVLQKYKTQVEIEGKNKNSNKKPDVEGLSIIKAKSLIQSAISGLSSSDIISEESLWLSKLQRKEEIVGNEQLEMAIYTGWHTGLAGPLFVLGKAKRIGLDVSNCKKAYFSAWDHIQSHYFQEFQNSPEGLYSGGAGIAIALAEGYNCGLLIQDENARDLIFQCFPKISSANDLATGLAGQGMAILHIASLLGHEQTKPLLDECIFTLLNRQNPNGTWPEIEITSIKGSSTGLDHGISGIILFLLSYFEQHPDTRVEKSVKKSINWLIGKANKKGANYTWSNDVKKNPLDAVDSGIILSFIKAYQIFKDPQYIQIAESCMAQVRTNPVIKDFTLATGLAGLGELYLEAAKTLNNEEWQKRADWIAQIFAHTFNQVDSKNGHWLADTNIRTADLFTGNSGIIHFMLRYYSPETVTHPLLP